MKKIKILNVIISICLLLLSLFLMWNVSIAADENIRVLSFLEQYNYIFWLLILFSFIQMMVNAVIKIKEK